jgi:hypothetical protein
MPQRSYPRPGPIRLSRRLHLIGRRGRPGSSPFSRRFTSISLPNAKSVRDVLRLGILTRIRSGAMFCAEVRTLYTRELFFFFKLCALRIAALPTGSRSLGTYRSLVRRYAEEFGIRTKIEVSDEVMVSALVLLWRKACIKLDSWDSQRGWRDFSEFATIYDVGVNGFRLQITEEGRELLAEMESQILEQQPIESREIGFHPTT